PQDYLTCWVPLGDVTIDNGCPWVMPGISRRGTLEHWQTDLGWQCLEGMEEAVPVEAKAGDMVVFSSLTPHRTGPNRTPDDRKSYILQYCHEGSVKVSGDIKEPQNHPHRQYPIVANGKAVA
nr:phytanoyl-CoA dioxygenase family protein [Pseudomonadales bacterium]